MKSTEVKRNGRAMYTTLSQQIYEQRTDRIDVTVIRGAHTGIGD
jgi:hypothetical protein